MNRLLRSPWTKVFVFLVCLAPALLLLWNWYKDSLGPNPVENLTH